MDKSIFKVFISKDKEIQWLNKLGQYGYLLDSVADSKYNFIINEEEKYYYSIEYLDCSPRSEKANEYFKSREDLGITPLMSLGNWVYFVSKDNEIEYTPEILKKNSSVYFWRTLYLLFFAICGSVFCGYHIYASSLLQTIGQTGTGEIELFSTDGGIAVLRVIKVGMNYFIKAINKYIGLWTDAFGKNDAIATVAIIVPLIILLIVIATFNIDSFMSFYGKRKKLKEQNNKNTEIIIQNSEEINNAE